MLDMLSQADTHTRNRAMQVRQRYVDEGYDLTTPGDPNETSQNVSPHCGFVANSLQLDEISNFYHGAFRVVTGGGGNHVIT